MKKYLLILAIAVAVYASWRSGEKSPADFDEPPAAASELAPQRAAPGDDPLASAFENQQSDVPVTGEGRVIRILGDDTLGDRHQRFILELDSGQSLLIAHNIDVAPRIDSLRAGDTVAFSGMYEWNDKGGVVHWTHHDPQGQHEAGWIRHQGRTYQ